MRLGSFQGEPLLPILGLRNIGQRPTTARVSLPLTDADGNSYFVELPEVKLLPGGTVDLSDAVRKSLDNRGIELEGSTAGVEVTYDSSPGQVITAVASISANFDHVFQVPALDPDTVQASAGGLPWSLADGRNTLLIFKNVTDSEQQFKYQIGFEAETYTSGLQTLEPGQTLAIDVRRLREEQVPDLYGVTIPFDADQGQALWSAYRPMRTPGNTRIPILARAESVDLNGGLASSYSCSNCCEDSFHSSFLSPSSLIGVPGGQEDVSAMERDINCFGTILNPFPVPANWSIANTSVATISSTVTYATVSCLAPGLTQMTAQWGAPLFHDNGLFCVRPLRAGPTRASCT